MPRFPFAAAALLAIGGTVATASPAEAQRYYHDDGRYDRYDGYDRYDRGDRYDRYESYERDYRPRYYRGGDYRYRNYRKCQDGTGGTIVGALAGGLLGHEIVGRGDRTIGTILGAAGGAIAGRAIDRSDRPGYCPRR